MPISEATKNQIRYTARHKIRIDYAKTITIAESEYWNRCNEITVEQSEFDSLELRYMHIKDPRLSKTNPYIGKQIYLLNTKLLAFQELFTDTIKCKIIGEPNIIEQIKRAKYFTSRKDWREELEEIRSYEDDENLNRYHYLEDIIIKNENRIEELKKRIYYEESFMDRLDKWWWKENIDTIKLPIDIYNNVKTVAKRYGISYDEVWYVWNKRKVEELMEINKNIEKQINELEHY